MAKHSPSAMGERSRIKLLYFEGELASGEIQALASAFAATRSVSPGGRGPQRQIAAATGESGVALPDHQVEYDLPEHAEVEESNSAAPSAPRSPRGKRTYPTPDPVEIDLDSGDKAFTDFAAEKAPESHLDKYLVVAEWLRAYRNIAPIKPGHVRTCYIRADWDFDVQDPNQPFRKLKKGGLGAIADGQFTINHLGTAAVKKMNAGKQNA